MSKVRSNGLLIPPPQHRFLRLGEQALRESRPHPLQVFGLSARTNLPKLTAHRTALHVHPLPELKRGVMTDVPMCVLEISMPY